MNAEKISKETIFRNIPVKSLKQSFDFRDNRPVAISQAKLIGTIQRAADIATTASAYPDNYLTRRALTFTRYGSKGYISASPGFGFNLGNIGDIEEKNNPGREHTEPRLISRYYGKAAGDWTVANKAVEDAGSSRAHFNLFTERKPCGYQCDIDANLKHARYTNDDKITWNTDKIGKAGDLEIAKKYLTKADEVADSGYTDKSAKLSTTYNTPQIEYQY